MTSNDLPTLLWTHAAASALSRPDTSAKDAASLADAMLNEFHLRFGWHVESKTWTQIEKS